MFTSRLVWLLPLLTLSVVQQSDAEAITIIDVGSAGSDLAGPAVQSAQYVQESWTQTYAYEDVTVSVVLFSFTPDVPFHVSAFLTTNTGASATPPALATTSFTAVTNVGKSFLLFSGLTLGAGTYYLTLSGTDVGPFAGAIWEDDLENFGGPSVLDSGVTLAAPAFCTVIRDIGCTPDVVYPPASSFSQNGFPSPDFTVTGTPEPSTLTMVLSAMAGCLFWRLNRRNQSRQE
jgi:hypothetical protein